MALRVLLRANGVHWSLDSGAARWHRGQYQKARHGHCASKKDKRSVIPSERIEGRASNDWPQRLAANLYR